MATIRRTYMPDGTIRAVWDDATAAMDRTLGRQPGRASRIEPIDCGRHRAKFHVDLSPLAEMAGRADWAVCLARPFGLYAEARAAEVAWLGDNYIQAASSADQSVSTSGA